ncbi:hypothetical protein CSC04_2549 [Enterobacter roggenkampii]|mgnify:FL=1|uniref:hypothetical protein n=1 Tax=Enterobacter roggenkampii TaxID=1812935 RepID=UPI000D037E5A|nr:hypothetical protein [Enterobacter roggenkampii]PRW41858.1 hypothetical protein CSC04_2549 [Enterobacter roggenkampii]QLV15780.1 hypothetical protein HV150_13870 [Enterobacter roggenkampii]
MNITDGIRFNNSNQTIIFNHYSWVELIKAIIVGYANKTESEAERIVLASPLVRITENDYMSVALRSHESEYHWAMLIVYGDQYWTKGVSSNEPEGYFEWGKEYKEKNKLAENNFIFSD